MNLDFLAEIYTDRIIICGQTLHRPSNIAPSQWMAKWESWNEALASL